MEVCQAQDDLGHVETDGVLRKAISRVQMGEQLASGNVICKQQPIYRCNCCRLSVAVGNYQPSLMENTGLFARQFWFHQFVFETISRNIVKVLNAGLHKYDFICGLILKQYKCLETVQNVRSEKEEENRTVN